MSILVVGIVSLMISFGMTISNQAGYEQAKKEQAQQTREIKLEQPNAEKTKE